MSNRSVKFWRGYWHQHAEDQRAGYFLDDKVAAHTSRSKMRAVAWKYAAARGWTVALTPPQRQKGKRE